ncbi:hypothetical protein V2J09_022650 [Rumex salicifolius]
MSFDNPNPSSGLPNFLFLFLLASLPLNTISISFNFPSSDGSNPVVVLQGNASISQSQIDLTENQIYTSLKGSIGRALFPTPIQLWKQDGRTKNLTDFTTQFTFNTAGANSTFYGDGLTFCLVPVNTTLPRTAGGGSLALFTLNENQYTFANNTIVAVEFDTYQNPWDPSSDHIGIDVNSVQSKVHVNVSVGLKNQTGQAFISYDSTAMNLSVSLTIEQSSNPYTVSLFYLIDLSTILPQTVQVGFSASTGSNVELHKILDWSFNSTLEATTISPTPASTPTITGSTSKGGLVAGIAGGLSLILIIGLFIVWRIRSKKKSRGQEEQESNIEATQFDIDDDFNEEAGPKRDIKCSNLMLDLNFNPKLGDFGLARLTDHDTGLQTTAVAGTSGYLAPECLLTGKASKESDVYSFGIAALEIACGRKVIEVKEEASKVNLPGWVWDLYGKGLILEAVDNRLEGEFDERQAECLMIAITTLNFETHLPSLPPQLPVPMYVSPGMNMSLYSSYVSTNTSEGSHDYTSGTSVNTSSTTNSSLQSISHTYPLLGVKK